MEYALASEKSENSSAKREISVIPATDSFSSARDKYNKLYYTF